MYTDEKTLIEFYFDKVNKKTFNDENLSTDDEIDVIEINYALKLNRNLDKLNKLFNSNKKPIKFKEVDYSKLYKLSPKEIKNNNYKSIMIDYDNEDFKNSFYGLINEDEIDEFIK